MFNLKTIRGKGLLASAFTLLIFLSVAANGMWGMFQLSNNMKSLSKEVVVRSEYIAPLLQVSNDIKNDVVQIQQWLTDISATRALDGLNDGMDVAAQFAQKFEKDTTLALALAGHLELTKVTAVLNEMRSAFPAYYATGQKMAKAYIDEGPTGGNTMMGKFDGTAERIGNSVDQLMKVVVALDLEETQAIHNEVVMGTEDAYSKIIMLGVFTLVGFALILWIAKRSDQMMSVIAVVSKALVRAKKGDLDSRITRVTGSDEIEEIQHSLNHLLDVAECYVREVRASMAFVSQGKYFRTIQEGGLGGAFLASARRINGAVAFTKKQKDDFAVVAKAFEDNMNTVVQTVTTAATELQSTAKSMETTASLTSEKSQAVSNAAEMASNNVQTVASAAEELSSSISEISGQVSQSASIASQAVEDAEKSGENVRGLAESASKISEVVSLISDIADQTNLLALNATIEAARAGDAGKGFAVVASEVKNLANQTAKATEDISLQVGDVQSATDEAVKAIQSIGVTIGKISEASTTIASAVEEQGAATQEIARNVEQAATGTNEVTAHISEVTQGATETGRAASEVLSAADELAKQGDAMTRELSTFLVAMQKVIK